MEAHPKGLNILFASPQHVPMVLEVAGMSGDIKCVLLKSCLNLAYDIFLQMLTH